MHQGRTAVAPAAAPGSPARAVVPVGVPLGPRTPQRHVALLSLFDGMGTARVAVDEVLRTLRAPPLVGAFFWEAASDLATAVEAAWRDAPDRGAGVAYLCLGPRQERGGGGAAAGVRAPP